MPDLSEGETDSNVQKHQVAPSVQRRLAETYPTAGSGHIHLATVRGGNRRAQFSTLRAAYPLKFLTPDPLPSQPPNIGVVYSLAYGGGLVAGDLISQRVEVDDGAGLVMLTQGSTKVFKHRPGIRPRSRTSSQPMKLDGSSARGSSATLQRLSVTLKPGSFLLLLPDPVSPFKGSNYAQSQRFMLPSDDTASVLVVDWFNSGRGAGFAQSVHPATASPGNGASQSKSHPIDPEIWSMDRYVSLNEVLIGTKLLMRERMVLEDRISPSSEPTFPSIASRMAPYHVYATMFIVGAHLKGFVDHILILCDRELQFRLKSPPRLLWSFSEIGPGAGVLRIAGHEVEEVRKWLREAMEAGGIQQLVGEALWPRII